jgi:hypothetical protein
LVLLHVVAIMARQHSTSLLQNGGSCISQHLVLFLPNLRTVMMSCFSSQGVHLLLRMKAIQPMLCFKQLTLPMCSWLCLLYVLATREHIMKHCGEKMDTFGKKQQSPRSAPFSRTALGMLLMHHPM